MSQLPNPFKFFSQPLRSRVGAAAFALCITFMAVLAIIGPPRLAQQLEAAQSQDELNSTIATFGEHRQSRALQNLSIDYLFIPCYVLAIGLACVHISARVSSPGWQSLALLIGWSTYVLGLTDVTENTLLWSLLTTGFANHVVTAARAATQI